VEPAAQSDSALCLYGVVRARAFRGRRAVEVPGVSRIPYREIEAVVRAVPFVELEVEQHALREHQRVVESTMRRASVLPFPFGVVFRDRRELIRFLEEQYLAIDEALSFVEGRWEVRVHMGVRGGEEAAPELRDLASHVYAELRRLAHAAQPMPPDDGRIFSAAFLVARTAWVEFVERGEDLAAADARLTLDITGPWPPYDFVRLVR
jgi:hypothetical protein